MLHTQNLLDEFELHVYGDGDFGSFFDKAKDFSTVAMGVDPARISVPSRVGSLKPENILLEQEEIVK